MHPLENVCFLVCVAQSEGNPWGVWVVHVGVREMFHHMLLETKTKQNKKLLSGVDLLARSSEVQNYVGP